MKPESLARARIQPRLEFYGYARYIFIARIPRIGGENRSGGIRRRSAYSGQLQITTVAKNHRDLCGIRSRFPVPAVDGVQIENTGDDELMQNTGGERGGARGGGRDNGRARRPR